jgi:sugar lactone lactonase YvrE
VNFTIERFTPGGVGSVFTNTVSPIGLAFDSAGNLYAANRDVNMIEKFTPGGVGSVFANTGLNSPIGLAFDSAGNLYAANYADNTIEQFTPGGIGSVFANTGLSNPTFLAFSTPEPSTWAMFAIGIAALVLRKRYTIKLR